MMWKDWNITSTGQISPQCGQVISVSVIKFMCNHVLGTVKRAAAYLLGTRFCRGRRFFFGSVAQFLKVELIHAAAIRLRDRDEVVADLNLFTLFRQMTEQMGDVPSDSAYVRALQLKLGELVQLVKSERSVHAEFVRVDLSKFLLF